MSLKRAAMLALAALAAPAVAVAADAPQKVDPAAARAIAAMPDYQPRAQVSGVIRLWGHGSPKRDFMGDLISRWIAEFRAKQPGIRIENRMYGTASAIGALALGDGDIALLGEEISPVNDQLFRRAKGYAPTKFDVATGSVDVNYFDYAHMIFVNKANPIQHLSFHQIEGMFGTEAKCGGRPIRNWGQAGLKGAWSGRTVTPYGWRTDVDFGLFLAERAMCGTHRWNPAMREFVHIKYPDGTQYDHGAQILDALARDPAGIAVSNVRYANAGVRAVPLGWTDRGPFVDATPATLIAQTYPLVRIIPAYVDKAPGRPVSPAAAEFLRYILSRQGQAAIAEISGYLPISPKVAAKERSGL